MFAGWFLLSCSVVKTTYKITKYTVKTTYKVTKGVGKAVYKIGKFTFVVVMAPLSWPLTHGDIESIDDLPPKMQFERVVSRKHLMWSKVKGMCPCLKKKPVNTVKKVSLPGTGMRRFGKKEGI